MVLALNLEIVVRHDGYDERGYLENPIEEKREAVDGERALKGDEWCGAAGRQGGLQPPKADTGHNQARYYNQQ